MSSTTFKHVMIYSKGICSSDVGPGGWGAVLVYKKNIKEIMGFAKDTTEERMELMAVLQGLMALKEKCKVSLYTDCSYIHNVFDKGWIIAWQNNGWLTRYNKPVDNQDLWKRILNLSRDCFVTWHKVKSSAEETYMKASQKLAEKQILDTTGQG